MTKTTANGMGDAGPITEAERHLEALGQVAGAVALEFNNLLTAIIGCVDLNLPDVDPDTQLAMDLEQIRASATRAAELAYHLLGLTHQHVAQQSEFDVGELVHDLAAPLRSLLDEGQDLEMRLCSVPLPLHGEQHAVEAATMAMFEFVRDAAPGPGLMAVRVTHRGADCVVSVTAEVPGATQAPDITESRVVGVVEACGGSISLGADPAWPVALQMTIRLSSAQSRRDLREHSV